MSVILDEWLNYKPLEKDSRNLYELFEQHSGNNSTIFVGQYPVDECHGGSVEGTQADSIMDRIIHNAYEIPANETNLRKLYDSKKLYSHQQYVYQTSLLFALKKLYT